LAKLVSSSSPRCRSLTILDTGRPRLSAQQLELLSKVVRRPPSAATDRALAHRHNSIASFSGDLSSLTAPPFILSPVSLTEFPAYWCERPDLFAAIADAKPGAERHHAVLRWFIVGASLLGAERG